MCYAAPDHRNALQKYVKTDNQSLKHKEKQMFELALKLLQSNNTGE